MPRASRNLMVAGAAAVVVGSALGILLGMCQAVPSQAQTNPAIPPTIAGCMVSLSGMEMRGAADLASAYYGLPEWLLRRVIERRENKRWDPRAVSTVGAIGLSQIRPASVCWRVPGCDSNDTHRLGKIEGKLKGVAYNLCWGARILADNSAICAENVACTLAGFYAGEGASGYIADILR